MDCGFVLLVSLSWYCTGKVWLNELPLARQKAYNHWLVALPGTVGETLPALPKLVSAVTVSVSFPGGPASETSFVTKNARPRTTARPLRKIRFVFTAHPRIQMRFEPSFAVYGITNGF